MFQTIETERLRIRAVRPEDAESLWQRRNDPEVARFQAWALPWPLERAREMVAGAAAMDGPTDGEWWMGTITAEGDGILGDVAVRLSWGGRSAEIGYTLSPEHWGQGYATEAAAALLDRLFADEAMTRVEGRLHPDNTASAMVLERIGMVYEGRTRLSYWVGDDNTDDLIYAAIRSDHAAWTGRTRTAPEDVQLVPVDQSNESAVYKLTTHKTQEEFVAPMKWSYADALFPEIVDGAPLVPWMRAAHADDDLVGFVMLALVTDAHPQPYLWRLLVDRLHQRRGVGRRILDAVCDEVRAMGHSTLLTSWGEGRGSPRPFYEQYGFVPTGRIIDDETEARLVL